jgi:hypothetical protein
MGTREIRVAEFCNEPAKFEWPALLRKLDRVEGSGGVSVFAVPFAQSWVLG